jgi:Ni/Co efflux regulator RcnB
MKNFYARATSALATFLLASTVATSAFADKPAWAGNKHEDKHHGEGAQRGESHDPHGGTRFTDHHRQVVYSYYGESYRSTGKCPPGLAKKNNGCMPPGQAKKWRVGGPLPAGVKYYDLPPALVVQLGQPPAGYRYVRVAADVLMIAVGTSLVVDAIQDLGRM